MVLHERIDIAWVAGRKWNPREPADLAAADPKSARQQKGLGLFGGEAEVVAHHREVVGQHRVGHLRLDKAVAEGGLLRRDDVRDERLQIRSGVRLEAGDAPLQVKDAVADRFLLLEGQRRGSDEKFVRADDVLELLRKLAAVRVRISHTGFKQPVSISSHAPLLVCLLSK